MRDFQAICNRLNIDRKHTSAAHYALCTGLDEAVSHTEWGGGIADSLGAWPRSALASTFHQDRQGGTKVFQIPGRLVESVPENIGSIAACGSCRQPAGATAGFPVSRAR
ncbi:DotU family type IV/VI secretion system protein [Cupriavidus sp. BIC8F]|uniref:DotU family type IV/VI secretion system protein n=1 Tax=Cupriavidus sp. BIC8F TaxID=3079014 RepID=UPI003967D4A2